VIGLLAVVVAEVSHCWGWMDSMAVLGHDGVEAIDGVSGVVHDTQSAVRLHEAVLTLDEVSITVLGLGLDVAGQAVSNSVVV
jgi:hypothetical protein